MDPTCTSSAAYNRLFHNANAALKQAQIFKIEARHEHDGRMRCEQTKASIAITPPIPLVDSGFGTLELIGAIAIALVVGALGMGAFEFGRNGKL